MTSRRFEITRVTEPVVRSESLPQPAEIIPLVHIENEIPPPPPLPPSLSSTRPKTTNSKPISSRLFNVILHRKSVDTCRHVATASLRNPLKKSSSAEVFPGNKSKSISHRSNSHTNFPIGEENDESDVYSTNHSNHYDANPVGVTNRFLQELRSKRRELQEKSKNIGIDLRIDLHRRQHQRRLQRAQDIFAVHFQINDEDDQNFLSSHMNLFTEESQEKIRNDIYKELNRQQKKQNRKQHRHLLLGRSLLFLMTSLLVFMGFTLIYVVVNLYARANSLDAKLPENEFIPMSFDQTTNAN